MRGLLLIATIVPPFALAVLATSAIAQEEAAPQSDQMVHMDHSTGTWRFLPDRVVLVPGGTLQLMIFGAGAFSLTLDDAPGYDADVAQGDAAIRTAQFSAPTTPGEYAFHDKHHPEARGLLVVRERPQAAEPAQMPTIGVVPGGYESRFAPARLEVAAGASVRFVANGTFGHNLQATDGSFGVGDLSPGASASFVAPTQPGEYAFECRFHKEQGMTGTLVVRPASAATPDGPARTIAGVALGGTLLTLGACAFVLATRSKEER